MSMLYIAVVVHPYGHPAGLLRHVQRDGAGLGPAVDHRVARLFPVYKCICKCIAAFMLGIVYFTYMQALMYMFIVACLQICFIL